MTNKEWTKAEPGECTVEYMTHGLVIGEAARAVIRNKGSAGIDGITFDQLEDYIEQHWGTIRQKIREGKYIPLPVKRVDIPKPNGGKRMLGIHRS